MPKRRTGAPKDEIPEQSETLVNLWLDEKLRDLVS
jgi:hypothetical protein